MCEEVCVFPDKCLENNILPFFCHNFDRFTSNIWSSYVTLGSFLFYTHVSTSPNSVTFFMISSMTLFQMKKKFPECKMYFR